MGRKINFIAKSDKFLIMYVFFKRNFIDYGVNLW